VRSSLDSCLMLATSAIYPGGSWGREDRVGSDDESLHAPDGWYLETDPPDRLYEPAQIPHDPFATSDLVTAIGSATSPTATLRSPDPGRCGRRTGPRFRSLTKPRFFARLFQ